MSEVANIFKNLVPEYKETYSTKKPKFQKIKSSVGKDKEKPCPCKKIEKCDCKVK